MQTSSSLRCGLRSLGREERGVVMVLVLVVMILSLGAGATALYSGYTNLQIATNLKLASQAKAQAEANVNEAIYRLSRQETVADAVAPDLTDPTWQVEIHFSSGDTDASDGVISTLQNASDWPEYVPDDPVIVRFKRPDTVAAPNAVLFYDPQQTPKFVTYTLPNTAIPASAHPVIQVLATALDARDVERQILAEVMQTTTFAPPAPLSSGVDVNFGGSAFIDGVNHHHSIVINPGAAWGDDGNETTNNLTERDSPDDHKNDGSNHGIANPGLDSSYAPQYASLPRMFNNVIASGSPISAWVGMTWNSGTNTWSGINSGYASAIAFSPGQQANTPPNPNSGVYTRGVFTWHDRFTTANNNMGALPFSPNCSATNPTLACAPPVLWHGPDSFSAVSHFPYFQEFLGLDDLAYHALLDRPDVCEGPLATCTKVLSSTQAPQGFTYIHMNSLTDEYGWNSSTASPTTEQFGLVYVQGSLRINANVVFKGVIFVDGSLTIVGSPIILGAVLVRGQTETAGTGNLTLLYSRKAAELGIQAGRPWRILSWTDTAMQ